jgi:hypothetical protein
MGEGLDLKFTTLVAHGSTYRMNVTRFPGDVEDQVWEMVVVLIDGQPVTQYVRMIQ